MTAPQTIDTDALRKLCEAATPGPWENDTADDRDIDYNWQQIRGPDDKVLLDCLNSDAAVIHEEGDEDGVSRWDETGLRNCELIVAARNALPAILDELDRLRAAEAASKARLEEAARIAESCGYAGQSAAYRIRALAGDAPSAEIARLTDAGAEPGFGANCLDRYKGMPECVWPECQCDQPEQPILAPPPPAAAERGVPGQSAEARLAAMATVTEAEVEAGCRAFAIKDGMDPEQFEPHMICGPNNEYRPVWQFYAEGVRAVLEAYVANKTAGGT